MGVVIEFPHEDNDLCLECECGSQSFQLILEDGVWFPVCLGCLCDIDAYFLRIAEVPDGSGEAL